MRPPDEPGIDAVYTWVDGAHPAFARLLSAALAEHRAAHGALPHGRAWSMNRFRDNDCLRYSLRALEHHAPWLRLIHIVTRDETPGWLSSDPRIRVVHHREIFPEACALPTFSSPAIESCLHRIPGLAPRYLYFNDDVFLWKAKSPEYFFEADGQPRIWLETWPMPTDLKDASPVGGSAAYCHHLLGQRFGHRMYRREVPHQPVAYVKSTVEEIELVWPDPIRQTRLNRFRTARDFVIGRMYLHYVLETRAGPHARGVTGDRIPPPSVGFIQYGNPALSLQPQLAAVEGRPPEFVCINDEATENGNLPESVAAAEAGALRRFLARHFPCPAPWELPHESAHLAGASH